MRIYEFIKCYNFNDLLNNVTMSLHVARTRIKVVGTVCAYFHLFCWCDVHIDTSCFQIYVYSWVVW